VLTVSSHHGFCHFRQASLHFIQEYAIALTSEISVMQTCI